MDCAPAGRIRSFPKVARYWEPWPCTTSHAALVARELDTIKTVASLAGIAIERKRSDEVLLRNMERFQIVARATNDAVWDWDLATNSIWWNEGYQTLFGYPPDEIRPGIESWYDPIHPEDRARIVNGVHALIDSEVSPGATNTAFDAVTGHTPTSTTAAL